jgi:hypothetical protein
MKGIISSKGPGTVKITGQQPGPAPAAEDAGFISVSGTGAGTGASLHIGPEGSCGAEIEAG